MPYCWYCGKYTESGSRFCRNCGNSLGRQHEEIGYSVVDPTTQHKREREKRCPYCNSTGKVDGPMSGNVTVICPICRGRRYNFIPEDWLGCRKCGGTGEFTYGAGIAHTRKPCPDCNGTGWVPE